ncbi:MAG: hypothetical protein HY543_06750 [Deltaproteobacteria bacterium]|nr:hypothetical protein [Deltaproteobacteria bacterium]
MKYGISHSFEDESLEAKAEWFMQKPLEERLYEAFESNILYRELCKFEPPDDRTTFTSFQILERPKG